AEERHIDILGRLLYTAKLVAKQEGLDDGYRIANQFTTFMCMLLVVDR
ncbi:14 kDa zinc-binding protein-like, partial [Trifolium medium]|nr:14 kDa zinc-binding protein-like [Trifolium medium]